MDLMSECYGSIITFSGIITLNPKVDYKHLKIIVGLFFHIRLFNCLLYRYNYFEIHYCVFIVMYFEWHSNWV